MNHITQGVIFNIQQFSVHDGDGIRTVVFLKGCPLKCQWCSNPESQAKAPQLAFNPGRCLTTEKCIRCINACPEQAISEGQNHFIQIDPGRCKGCFTCADNCPAGALNVYGETKNIQEIIDHVEKDALFYKRSGGGITLSGGEAMAQPEFAVALLKKARQHRIHTAMETSCFCRWEDLAQACGHLCQVICDIKHLDDQKHKMGTSVGNRLILENIKKMIFTFPDLPVLVRTPVIPGFNDNEYDIQAIADFIPKRKGVAYELLPYHPFGDSKYIFLGMDNPCRNLVLDEDRMAQLKNIERNFNESIGNMEQILT
jgi:pyruvate formate lyase activating enzyme